MNILKSYALYIFLHACIYRSEKNNNNVFSFQNKEKSLERRKKTSLRKGKKINFCVGTVLKSVTKPHNYCWNRNFPGKPQSQ